LKALAAAIGPGLALTTAIAVVAFAAHELPGLSLFNPMVLGLAIGIAWRNVAGLPLRFATGLVFSQRTILRVAIVLLGLQITAADIVGVGATGLAIVVVTLVVTFVVTVRLGALMKIDSGLVELLAAGTSICGASAIVAVNTVTRARDENVAYAVACITVCGSVAIFVFPAVSSFAHLTDRAYGLWAGSSIHEIAQVVAAAYQDGPIAGAFATLVKLTRILMLGPMVMVLGLFAVRRIASASTGSRQVARFPWFIAGFLALAALNSVTSIPAPAMDVVRPLTTFFLTVALSAFGLGVNVGLIRSTGTKPFLLCVLASLFIAGLSLGLIALTS
jgi:uncharacterized integral membrane protein (TIGR00698 family)